MGERNDFLSTEKYFFNGKQHKSAFLLNTVGENTTTIFNNYLFSFFHLILTLHSFPNPNLILYFPLSKRTLKVFLRHHLRPCPDYIRAVR